MKLVINLKKSVVYVLAAVAVLTVSSSSWAAYAGITKSTVARVAAAANIPGGAGFTDLTVSIKAIADDTVMTSVTWTVPANMLTTRVNKWLTADRYLYITSTMSTRGGAIQIYTDNSQLLGKNAKNALPYNIVATTTTYGASVSTTGLYPIYLDANGSQASTGPAIPLACRISSGSFGAVDTALDGLNTVVDAKKAGHIQDGTLITGFYPWLYVGEYANSFTATTGGDMGNNAKIQRAGLGLQTSEGAYNADGDMFHYLYLAADFTNALDATEYRANIVIEAFKE